MKELKGTLIYSVSNLAIKFGGVVLLPIMTRYFSPEDYGAIGYLAPISAILGLVLGLGLYAPIMKKSVELENNTIEFSEYFITYVIFLIFILFIFSLLILNDSVMTIVVYYTSKDISQDVIRMALFSSIFLCLNSISIGLLKVREKYKIVAFIALLSFTTHYLSTILLVSNYGLGSISYFAGMNISGLIVLIISYFVIMKGMVFSFSARKILYGVKNGFPMIFVELGDRFSESVDRLILVKFIQLSTLGVYTLGFTCARVVGVIGNSYSNVLMPQIYKSVNEGEGDKNRLVIKIVKFYEILVMACVISQLASYDVFDIFFTDDFQNVQHFFILLIPVVAVQYFFVLDFYFHANEDSKYVPLITLASMLLSVILNLILIPIYGIYGSVMSSVISFTFRFLLQVALVKVFYNIRFNAFSVILISSTLFIIPIFDGYITNYETIYRIMAAIPIIALLVIEINKLLIKGQYDAQNVHSSSNNNV